MSQILKPQLAKNYWDYEAKFQDSGRKFSVTQKLDGVRCLYDADTEQFYTRSGKPIEGLDQVLKDLKSLQIKDVWFDGELLLTPDITQINKEERFDNLSGKVRRHGPKTGLYYHIFDCYHKQAPEMYYESRREFLARIIRPLSFVKLIPVLARTTNWDVIDILNRRAKQQGWEGLMVNLHGAGTEYAVGKRSANLLKVKRWYDDEFLCIGTTLGEGKHEGRIGALIVEVLWTAPNGLTYKKHVQVGTGLSDFEREKIDEFYVGEYITVKYFEKTVDGSLRFPVYKGVRCE